MLRPANVNSAEREENVATQMMDARELGHEIVVFSVFLRTLEQLERFREPFGDPKAFGKADLRPAQARLVRRRTNNFPIDPNRARDVAEIVVQLAFETHQRMTLVVSPHDLERAFDQLQRSLGLIAGALRLCCLEI